MTHLGNLQYDDNTFDFEETNVYGIYESDGYMTWHIEIFPSGEENYIMFNSLVLDNVFSPRQLTEKTFKANADNGDLYEHTVRVNGEDRFLKTVDLTFGKWDIENQSLPLSGHGTIEAEDSLPEITYKFDTVLNFKELNIFETTQWATQQFIDTHFPDRKDKLETRFENVASGLQATIVGQF